mgnify:CR=1 FL=1
MPIAQVEIIIAPRSIGKLRSFTAKHFVISWAKICPLVGIQSLAKPFAKAFCQIDNVIAATCLNHASTLVVNNVIAIASLPGLINEFTCDI